MRDNGQPAPQEALAGERKDLKLGKLYVEIGSGGSPAFFLSKRALNPGDKYVTVDLRAHEHRTSAVFGEIEFGDGFEAVLGDGKTLPFADNSTDEVIFNNVFGDEKTFQREALLKEAGRIVKPGEGQIVITEHITPTIFLDIAGETQEAVGEYLSKNGIDLKVKKFSIGESGSEDYIGKREKRVIQMTPLQIILEK